MNNQPLQPTQVAINIPTNNTNNNNNNNQVVAEIFKASSHPIALFFHLLFRSLAIILFFISGLFNATILFAITTILLLAFDFWTVKNISGRLLVGLRWWNDVKEDGKSTWIFESKNRELVNKTDSGVFWTSLYVYTLIWIVLLVIEIIRLKFLWSVIVFLAITLNMANVTGYTKCDRDAKQRVQGFVTQGLMNGLMSNFVR